MSWTYFDSRQNKVRGEEKSSQTWWESKQGSHDVRGLLGWRRPGRGWNTGMRMQEAGPWQAAPHTSQGSAEIPGLREALWQPTPLSVPAPYYPGPL